MPNKPNQVPRRRFLNTTVSATGAAFLAPTIIPSSALGLDGAVAPSERIVVGGIGIGRRGGYDLGCFLEQKDVHFAAVCDIKQKRRREVKHHDLSIRLLLVDWLLCQRMAYCIPISKLWQHCGIMTWGPIRPRLPKQRWLWKL